MASSSTGSRHVRRFLLLAVLIVLAIAAYSAGWYWLAREADRRVAASIEALARDGVEITCANRSIRGYPFRIGVFCDEIGFSDPAQGVTLSAGALRSAAQVYQPFFLVGELDSPARLEAVGLSEHGLSALALDWEILRASVRLASPLPERLSLEGRNVTVAASEGTSGPSLARLDHVEAHMRPNGPDLDLALRLQNLQLDPSLLQGRVLPAFSGNADIVMTDGAALAAAGDISLRGRSGIIRGATLASGDASLSLEGPFSVDEQGLMDAEFQLAVRDPEALGDILREALPELADEIEAAAAALSALGGESLPLTISRGRISLGFFPLGEIPPL